MSKFISEADIEEKKKKMKEAWDATRGDSDPEEPPEEPPHDNRSLYHRLEEQRLKKQEEYEDTHRLKNMVRGLEDDEIEFLDLVDRKKIEQERKLKLEEHTALSEFRKRRIELEIEQTSKLVTQTVASQPVKKNNINSQKSLLSGAIKRKSTATANSSAKKPKTEESCNGPSSNDASDSNSTPTATASPPAVDKASNSDSSPPKPLLASGDNLKCAGVLPGLGVYSDSSNSSDDSNSDDDIALDVEDDNYYAKDLTGRYIRSVKKNHQC